MRQRTKPLSLLTLRVTEIHFLFVGFSMNIRKRERFKELCEHAEVVNAPEKLAKIASQIYKILQSQLARLKKRAAKSA
jgi:hypothetical protein